MAEKIIDLYAMSSPNVQKVYIALEEMGLAYRAHQVNIWTGEQFTPDFVAMNPNSKVPVIVDQDGPGGAPLTVFESGSILLYLAEKTGTFLPTEPRARSIAQQWLMIQLCSIGPMFGQMNHFRNHAPDNDYGVTRYTTETRRLYNLVEKRLQESPYLGGAEYGIADIATYPWIRTEARIMGDVLPFLNPDQHPAMAKWFAAIAARPAVQRAYQAIDSNPSRQKDATDKDKNRLFGRGDYAYRPAN